VPTQCGDQGIGPPSYLLGPAVWWQVAQLELSCPKAAPLQVLVHLQSSHWTTLAQCCLEAGNREQGKLPGREVDCEAFSQETTLS
jgi:hypothetical protein